MENNILAIIYKVQHKSKLSKCEIKWVIDEFTNDKIPDYQMSALLMAIYFNSLSKEETTDLTIAMWESGDTNDLSGINGFKVDKHSTGGVGDKTSLAVVPIVAACGGIVAKYSGRGLGHTGGTIDKLESIPGFNVSLSQSEFIKQVQNIGCAISGATTPKNLRAIAPADKKIYALRDVTNTVQSLPLITSSIMSKKLASGADGIVLDVKYGSGAFMKNLEDAKELAHWMVSIGTDAGKKMDYHLGSMDTPLGHSIGNSLEVQEVIELLNGKYDEDLMKDCLILSQKMLKLCEIGYDDLSREHLIMNSINNGKAYKKFKEMISAQNGSLVEFYEQEDTNSYELIAKNSGIINKMDVEKIGLTSVSLGAGRFSLDTNLDYLAGIKILKKTGDSVSKNECIAILYSQDISKFKLASQQYLEAIEII